MPVERPPLVNGKRSFAYTEYLIEMYRLFSIVKILFNVEEVQKLICSI